MPRAVLLAFALVLFAVGEAAAQWRFTPGAAGMSGGAVSGPGVPAAALTCTRPGFDLAEWTRRTGESHAPAVTGPGELALLIDAGRLPSAKRQGEADERTGWALVADVDGEAFGLPAAYDLTTGAFAARLPAEGGLASALMRGAAARFSVEGHPDAVSVPLSGSSRSIAALREFCAAPLDRAPEGVAATEAPASVRLSHPDALAIEWLESPSAPREALAYVHTPGGGNSAALDVLLYREEGGLWAEKGRVSELFGGSPRDAVFGPDAIRVTMTTLKPGDPRCCPTGVTRYAIDRAALSARRLD